MENTCNRCHQTVEPDASFCPHCGLPQLVYSDNADQESGQQVRWDEAVRDASSVAWKPALRSMFMLAGPAGVAGALLGLPGLVIMAISGAWAVSLYRRSQKPAWITIGAGARIGLVFGIIAGWIAVAAGGGTLFVQRYGLKEGVQIDTQWKQFVEMDSQATQKIAEQMGMLSTAEAEQQRQQNENWMLSPEGHAALVTADLVFSAFLFAIFAMAGGALSARMLARQRPRS
jgi:ABC-type antimicrobial peptide transport system permease subunit